MAGQRSSYNTDFMTPRAIYRIDVDAADASGPTDEAVPILDTRGGPNANIGLGQASINAYGRNAQLNIAVIIEGFSAITVQLWLKAEVEQRELSTVDAPADPTLPDTEDWVLVEPQDLTVSQLWVLTDIPPGQYKILVSAVTGSGHVNIREQHAA